MTSNGNGNGKGNGDPTVHHIWEGLCGMKLEPQKKNDGTYFWKYSFTRAFKRDGSDTFEYRSDFSDHNNEALGVLMLKGIRFREENDASLWVREKMLEVTKEVLPQPAEEAA